LFHDALRPSIFLIESPSIFTRVLTTVGASVVIESCGSFGRFAPQDDVGRRFIIRSDIQQTMRVKCAAL
jgi:hypothetical protein